MRAIAVPFLVMAFAACSSSPSAGSDAGGSAPDAAVSADAGGVATTDAGGAHDVGSAADVGLVAPDAGSTPDVGAGGPDGGPTIFGYEVSAQFGSIVFNEVLMDGTTDGDPNGDGDANPVEDQFVELVNKSGAAIALDGFTLVDLDFPDLPRHTFAAYSFPAGHAVVVFGGGDAPDPTATATFFSANAADPGLPFGLHLASPADAIFLLDGDQKVVAYFCYGGTVDCPLAAASDQSLTRSPDVTGDFVPHKSAAGSNGAAFSVGTRVDGSAF